MRETRYHKVYILKSSFRGLFFFKLINSSFSNKVKSLIAKIKVTTSSCNTNLQI